MKKWFMIPLTLFHQKPYQKGGMSLNTLDKYILGDIEAYGFRSMAAGAGYPFWLRGKQQLHEQVLQWR